MLRPWTSRRLVRVAQVLGTVGDIFSNAPLRLSSSWAGAHSRFSAGLLLHVPHNLTAVAAVPLGV
jgi:hypothetical protein